MSQDQKSNEMFQTFASRTRFRAKNKKGARHAVNPAGTKIARQFERRAWSGRVRMPA